MDDAKGVLSVSALNRAIKMAIEPGFQGICVKGEVGDYRLQASGHEYFTLKDDKSLINCVFFKGYRAQSPLKIKPGDQIIIEGDLGVYEVRGTYQIIVKRAKAAGVGDLLMKIHQLKTELEQLGWFNKENKKPLPRFPKTIGVVTSPTGSVIQDIIHVLERRHAGFHLVLNPVKVQGAGAAVEIAQAIDDMNRFNLADVLIIGRGGGSLEDLMPFNERCVAEAIFRSHIPVISAVGHETDVSIADFVADCRAPTPSAAAEIVSSEKAALLDRLALAEASLTKTIEDKVRVAHRLMRTVQVSPLFSDPTYLLKEHFQKVDDIDYDLQSSLMQSLKEKQLKIQGFVRQKESLNPLRQLKELNLRLDQYKSRLHIATATLLEKKKNRLVALQDIYASINPKKLLSRGYCIPFAQNSDSVIISSKQLKIKEHFRLLMQDGEVLSQVEDIK
ncbi:MAG: exodeoxyribonuclease VII large subunit [Simkaniaceae bacterium]|nr:exodeoxyribonuclease VII large subunit [Simkaniaceae bacterium]